MYKVQHSPGSDSQHTYELQQHLNTYLPCTSIQFHIPMRGSSIFFFLGGGGSEGYFSFPRGGGGIF